MYVTYFSFLSIIVKFTVSQNPNSVKMKLCIQGYVAALIIIRTKLSGVEHILTCECIIEGVENLITKCYNNVYTKSHCKQPKQNGSAFGKKSIMQMN